MASHPGVAQFASRMPGLYSTRNRARLNRPGTTRDGGSLVKARRAKRRKASVRSILATMLVGGAAKVGPRPTEGFEKYVPMDAREGEREVLVRQRLLDQSASAEARYEALF